MAQPNPTTAGCQKQQAPSQRALLGLRMGRQLVSAALKLYFSRSLQLFLFCFLLLRANLHTPNGHAIICSFFKKVLLRDTPGPVQHLFCFPEDQNVREGPHPVGQVLLPFIGVLVPNLWAHQNLLLLVLFSPVFEGIEDVTFR